MKKMLFPGLASATITWIGLFYAADGLQAKEASRAPAPIQIGSRLELMLDDYLIESKTNVSFRLHSPQAAEKALAFDKEWEGPYCDYVTVFKDGEQCRMYYAARDNYWGGNERTCYAESPDGIRWTKPSLGLVEFKGSRDNNIILRGNGSENFSPFIDTAPNVPKDRRYKAIGGVTSIVAFVSGDGIHWTSLSDRPMLGTNEPAFKQYNVAFWNDDTDRRYAVYDSHNVAFWDPNRKKYVYYFRAWVGFNDAGKTKTRIRTIFCAVSEDFIHWSDIQPLEFSTPPSSGDQFYTNDIQTYYRAPHLYLAFPMRFCGRRALSPAAPKGGLGEGIFMFSRDGKFFHRYMDAFLPPGPDLFNWNKHNNMIAWGMLPSGENEISIFYTQHYFAKTAHLKRGVLRTDGFVSLHAPYEGGEFVTRPLIYTGTVLVINAATGISGSVRVEIQDEAGIPIRGFAEVDCFEFFGDSIAHKVLWKSDASIIAGQANRPVRLKFFLRDADLYSFQFKDEAK